MQIAELARALDEVTGFLEAEGIDLQNHCHRLIHLEIPWNPNRMEQRNGRIDRHGQTKDPLVYHFAGQGYKQRVSDARAVPPSELEAEQAAIRARFADPQLRLFPVAVTFLAPERFDR